MIRLFTALELPLEVRERLSALGGGVPGARWLGPDQMHVTLRFIGEVDGALFEDIRVALSDVAAEPFTYTIGAPGIFGKMRAPRLLYASIRDQGETSALHDRMDKRLTGLGLEPERRKFIPHVTLARFKNGQGRRIGGFLEHNSGLEIAEIKARSFTLFSSFLSHNGAIYRVEESYPFTHSDTVAA